MISYGELRPGDMLYMDARRSWLVLDVSERAHQANAVLSITFYYQNYTFGTSKVTHEMQRPVARCYGLQLLRKGEITK